MPEEIFGGPSWSHCMPSLMICCPYTCVFTGERERFPSWIDDPVPSDREKEDGNDSSKGLFLERMSQVAITGTRDRGDRWLDARRFRFDYLYNCSRYDRTK